MNEPVSILRPHAEDQYAAELAALAAADDRPVRRIGGCPRGPPSPICSAGRPSTAP